MKSHIDPDSLEEVFSINRIFSNKSQSWVPALVDKASHDVDALWVAAVLYMILDRYTTCVSDDKQIAFLDLSLKIFNKMIEEGGEEFIWRIDRDGNDS
jgi:hypothetical protein